MAQILGDYLKRQLKKGFSRQEIKAALKKAGYKQTRIEEAFTKLPKQLPEKPKPVQKIVPKKKYWVIGIIILIILGSVSLGFYLYTNSQAYLIKKDIEICYDRSADYKLRFTALKKNDPSFCEKIKFKNARAFCQAELTQNPAFCDVLEGFDKEYCMTFITKKIEDCLKFNEEGYCKMLLENDVEACNTLSFEDYRTECIARARLDLSYFDEANIKSSCES